jgi:hypothetical protein
MRKNINLPVFAVVGATVLFVGFARNASAIPDSMGSWNSGYEQSDYDAVRGIGRSDGNQSFTSSSSFVVFGADLKENKDKPHDLVSRHFERDSRGAPGASPASVPDGGMTVMMLGGSICGLVLLTKKLKV